MIEIKHIRNHMQVNATRVLILCPQFSPYGSYINYTKDMCAKWYGVKNILFNYKTNFPHIVHLVVSICMCPEGYTCLITTLY